jgi:hypothetical protein
MSRGAIACIREDDHRYFEKEKLFPSLSKEIMIEFL